MMPFLRNVTAGRNVPDSRLAIVAEQYGHFDGKSPINDLSRAMVASLRSELAAFSCDLPVYWGTRNWAPYLRDTVQQMAADGIKRALVFTDSAFGSYSGCRQYQENLEAAAAAVGKHAPVLDKLRLYFNHPGFIEPYAANTMSAIAEHRTSAGEPVRPEDVRLIFTAHSLPRSMADCCDYETQLAEAVDLVVDRLGPHRPNDYELVYQSRSGPPHIPWLGPDICERLETINVDQPITLVPIGFTADHTEVLYDLGIQAAEVATRRGLAMTRAKAVGTSHMFIKMIRELIEEETEGGPRLALGTLGPVAAHTGDDHCLDSKQTS